MVFTHTVLPRLSSLPPHCSFSERMLGTAVQNSLSIRSNAAHIRFRLDQTTKSISFNFKPLVYLPPSIPLQFRCLVLSTNGASGDQVATKKSDAVVSLFHSYGFSEDQVAWILHKQPKLRTTLNPEKTIRPKLDYLLDFGYNQSELVILISSDPHLLGFSLEKRIVHNVNILKQLLSSVELVKKAIGRSSRLLRYNLEKYMVPTMETLRMHGVPDRRIVQAVASFPRVMTHKPDLISGIATELEKLGMDPSSRAFIVGINAKVVMAQSVWDSKEALYKSLGWSDEDFLSAFKKHPYCMLNSEGKIKKMMDFYINNLGWDPAFLSERPILIDLSLERRVLPRCTVLNMLASRRLLGGERALPKLLLLDEGSFEADYVLKYSEEISVLRKAYDGMIEGDFTALRTWEESIRQKETEEKQLCSD